MKIYTTCMPRFLLFILMIIQGEKAFCRTFYGGSLPIALFETTTIITYSGHDSTSGILLQGIYTDHNSIHPDPFNGGGNINYTKPFSSDFRLIHNLGFPTFKGLFKTKGSPHTALFEQHGDEILSKSFAFKNTKNNLNTIRTRMLMEKSTGEVHDAILRDRLALYSNMCPFTVDAGPDITVCSGADVVLTAVHTAANPVTYAWDNGETTASISFLNIMSGGTYSVTVTDMSGCTAKDDVIITVDPTPSGTPYTAQECESNLPGIARFNLSEIINLHFGSQPVTFYEDINLTIPILQLNPYSSPSTVIYAVITLGNCSSVPIPITLEVVITHASDFSLLLFDGRPTCCDTVVITFPHSGDFLVDIARVCEDGNDSSGPTLYSSYLNDFVNDFDDNDNTYSIIICEDCTYTITSITDIATNCGVTFNNPLSVTTVVPEPPDFITSPGYTCPGKTIDLLNLIVVPPGALITFHGRNPPTHFNVLPSSIVSPTESITYYANVEINGCFYVVPISVNVISLPSFTTTIDVCEKGPPLHLYSNAWPYTLPGEWSGPGVTGTMFDPFGLTGQVVLNFDPESPCYEPGTLTINLLPDVPYSLMTTEICASANNFDLSTLVVPSNIAGSWVGPGASGSSLNPYGLSGLIDYTFVPYDMCITPSYITIKILPGPKPVIDSLIQVCKGDTADLKNYVHHGLKDSLAFYASVLFTDENILPSSKVLINGNITYFVKVTDSLGCFVYREIKIKAIPSGVIKLGKDTVCNYELLYDLNQLNDALIKTGVWTGTGVINDTLDLSGLDGVQIVTFTPENVCFPPDSTTITIASSPSVSGLNITCDFVAQTYQVAFDITGGDTSTYIVNGIPAMGHYVSASIPSQTNYTFTIFDAYQCDSITIQGIKNCDCLTDAGTMNFANTPLKVCIPGSAGAVFNNDALLENNDQLLFVLHDGSGPSLGNVYGYSDTPTFGFPPGGDKNLIYYISAIAGDRIAVDSIDLNDDCLSVSAGVPVLFYEPKIGMATIQNVCIQDCADVTFTLSGAPPFTFIVEYSHNSTVIHLDTITTSNNGYTSSFCPNNKVGEVGVHILEFSDKNCQGILNNNPQTFTVYPLRNRVVDDILCASESIVINGVTYNASNPSGTEIIEVGQNGVCDSIAYIDLQVMPLDTVHYEATLCDKQQLIINGTVYSSSNPLGTEVFAGGGQYGCDSVMVIDLTFNGTIEVTINQPICTGESIIVNGVIYDATKLTGTEVIVSNDASQCDSIIHVNLTIADPPTYTLNETLCRGESLTVNGTLYDEGHLTGQEILTGASASGCDSIINVQLNYLLPAAFTLNDTLCAGESIVIHGEQYNESSPTGSHTIQNGSINGCDSIITISLHFLLPTTSTLRDTLCSGESIVINGELYSESSPTGSQTIQNGSVNGCDSIIDIRIHFLLPTASTIRDTLCAGESIVIHGELYDESHTTGSHTIKNGSLNGCDSIIAIRIYFLSPTAFTLRDTLCAGESIVINGVLYDESHTTGNQTITNGSANGCDSIVAVNLSFYPIIVDTLKLTLTKGDSITINGVLFNDGYTAGLTVDSTFSIHGCTMYTYVIINFKQEFIDASVSIINESCQGKKDGQVTITAIRGCNNYTITLGNNVVVNPVFPLTIENLAPGNYTLIIEGAVDCSYSQSIDILPSTAEGFSIKKDAFSLLQGTSSILDVGIDPVPHSIQWSPADYLSCVDCIEPSVIEIQQPVIYSISLTDDGGCAFTYAVEVKLRKFVDEIEFPNIFSPNGDGRNDSWEVLFTDDEQLVNITIHDRWGNNVHVIKVSPDQEKLSWDGTLNGQVVVPGVYVYVAEIMQRGQTLKVKSGDFTVIR